MSGGKVQPGAPAGSGSDPSMEDILASIRRILSEEDMPAGVPPPPPVLRAPEPVSDVLILDESMLVEDRPPLVPDFTTGAAEAHSVSEPADDDTLPLPGVRRLPPEASEDVAGAKAEPEPDEPHASPAFMDLASLAEPAEPDEFEALLKEQESEAEPSPLSEPSLGEPAAEQASTLLAAGALSSEPPAAAVVPEPVAEPTPSPVEPIATAAEPAEPIPEPIAAEPPSAPVVPEPTAIEPSPVAPTPVVVEPPAAIFSAGAQPAATPPILASPWLPEARTPMPPLPPSVAPPVTAPPLGRIPQSPVLIPVPPSSGAPLIRRPASTTIRDPALTIPPRPEPEPPAEAPVVAASEAPPPLAPQPESPAMSASMSSPTIGGIASDQTANAAAGSVTNLVRALSSERTQVHSGGPTIADLVREEIRPLLKDWLDSNLPPLVERLVRAEIERVISRAAI